jgi:hypothetical protein
MVLIAIERPPFAAVIMYKRCMRPSTAERRYEQRKTVRIQILIVSHMTPSSRLFASDVHSNRGIMLTAERR